MFIDLANQIAEVDGEVGIDKIITEGNNRGGSESNRDSLEYLKCELKNKETEIKITSKNLPTLHISYYKIDLEIMFTENPFLSSKKKESSKINKLSRVRAHHQEIFKPESSLEEEYSNSTVKIPEELKTSNLII